MFRRIIICAFAAGVFCGVIFSNRDFVKKFAAQTERNVEIVTTKLKRTIKNLLSGRLKFSGISGNCLLEILP